MSAYNPQAGGYDITLLVTDNDGNTGLAVGTITVYQGGGYTLTVTILSESGCSGSVYSNPSGINAKGFPAGGQPFEKVAKHVF